MRKTGLFLALILALSFTLFGQNNINEIKDKKLKNILVEGFNQSEKLFKNFQQDSQSKSIKFRFDYSNVRLINSNDAPMFYFTVADTSVYKIENIEEIRYSYLYTFKKVEINYTILYSPSKNATFLRKFSETELKILLQLERGECSKCFTSVENFIKKSAIKNYRLEVEITDLDSIQIANRFLWKVIVKKSNGLNSLFFVSPVTGKKVDISKLFAPPKIK